MKVMQAECPFCNQDIEDCCCQVDSSESCEWRRKTDRQKAQEVERLVRGLQMMDWD